MPIDIILPAGEREEIFYVSWNDAGRSRGKGHYYMHQGDRIKARKMEFTCIFEKEEKERNAHSLVLCYPL